MPERNFSDLINLIASLTPEQRRDLQSILMPEIKTTCPVLARLTKDEGKITITYQENFQGRIDKSVACPYWSPNSYFHATAKPNPPGFCSF